MRNSSSGERNGCDRLRRRRQPHQLEPVLVEVAERASPREAAEAAVRHRAALALDALPLALARRRVVSRQRVRVTPAANTRDIPATRYGTCCGVTSATSAVAPLLRGWAGRSGSPLDGAEGVLERAARIAALHARARRVHVQALAAQPGGLQPPWPSYTAQVRSPPAAARGRPTRPRCPQTPGSVCTPAFTRLIGARRGCSSSVTSPGRARAGRGRGGSSATTRAAARAARPPAPPPPAAALAAPSGSA